ncbi:MAG: SGNH/GDSL hydrolase family protein [Bacilli bacterium]|nr:SGNH/GDSL hydrolase family protein [Bacilli bacterium]MDD4411352.1 SGNH/GDSL hydrolase family protein [Bacilli bacterium]
MKKFIIMVLFVGLPILIYLMTIDNKIYYVALGDSLAAGQNSYGKIAYGYADYIADDLRTKNKLELYTKDFAVSGHRTTDLINDINNNKKALINEERITIKQALTKADLVTISIGANDLFYKMGLTGFDITYYNETDLKKYVDEIILDIEKLIVLTKKYCKEDIILIGYYNPLWSMKKSYAADLEATFIYANEKMLEITKKHDIYYVDIHKTFNQGSDLLPNPLDIHPSSAGYVAIGKKIMDIINTKILNSN